MRVVIVGGRLQGIEAAYLSAKAGWEVVLLDRDANVPAVGLADEFHQVDVTETGGWVRRILGRCDVMLPACENRHALECLCWWAHELDMPLAFDLEAFCTTSSKTTSNLLFKNLAVPRPASWPECGYPVIVKPDGESGSHGVAMAHNALELEAAFAGFRKQGRTPVVQQFIPGRSLSVEVVRSGGRSYPYQVTELEFDPRYDCKRVVAPATPNHGAAQNLRGVGGRLADALELSGIMDVEAMVDGSTPAVIEIDARLPSQTPSVVFHSSGINLVELVVGEALGSAPSEWTPERPQQGAVYQHLAVEGAVGSVVGEARFSLAGPLRLVPDFFGCDEALTDYRPGSRSWVATLVTTGRDAAEARSAGSACIQTIARRVGLTAVRDEGPAIPQTLAPGLSATTSEWDGVAT